MAGRAITVEEVVSVTVVEGCSPGLAIDVGDVVVGPEVPVAVLNLTPLGILLICHHIPRPNAQQQEQADRNSVKNLHARPPLYGLEKHLRPFAALCYRDASTCVQQTSSVSHHLNLLVTRLQQKFHNVLAVLYDLIGSDVNTIVRCVLTPLAFPWNNAPKATSF
jgi:hypothetical protein